MTRSKDHNQETQSDMTQCGIIMPISATSNRTEAHWESIQKLIHRAIKGAGFEPRNVWESSSTDRISERIIGNIFNFDIIVADVSDLNPNVMFELGLRLASKKPTVVIANVGGQIPFDIRDFEILFYPADMNMLEMEKFFEKLEKLLRDRLASFKSESYSPFLSGVIVDVASPETREVGFNDLIISRLDDISRRVALIETSNRQHRDSTVRPRLEMTNGSTLLEIPLDNVRAFTDQVILLVEVDSVEPQEILGDRQILNVHFSGPGLRKRMEEKIIKVAELHGGDTYIPF